MHRRKVNFALLDRAVCVGRNPGRTPACTHKECFDIYNVELIEPNKPFVKCPICEAVAHKDDLVDDRSVRHAIEAIKWNSHAKAWLSSRLRKEPSSLSISHFLDPLTPKQIEIPVRGPTCWHALCFDLKTYFLEYPNLAGRCPICRDRAPITELVIDTAATEQLSKLREAYVEHSRPKSIDVETYQASQRSLKRPKLEETETTQVDGTQLHHPAEPQEAFVSVEGAAQHSPEVRVMEAELHALQAPSSNLHQPGVCGVACDRIRQELAAEPTDLNAAKEQVRQAQAMLDARVAEHEAKMQREREALDIERKEVLEARKRVAEHEATMQTEREELELERKKVIAAGKRVQQLKASLQSEHTQINEERVASTPKELTTTLAEEHLPLKEHIAFWRGVGIRPVRDSGRWRFRQYGNDCWIGKSSLKFASAFESALKVLKGGES